MDQQSISFEYFPPRTESAKASLIRAHKRLCALQPEYVSVTFGAGGSTQEGTYETVKQLLATGVDVAPHLSCVGRSTEQLRDILQRYKALGVTRIVALRGDLPSGSVDHGDFRYANELVSFIRAETGDHFFIEVGAYPEIHPQAPSPDADIDNFVRKAQSGADRAITQYFYNADGYFRFVDDVRKRGCDIEIVPGIMPINNFTQLARFSDMCGAEIPYWIRKRLQAFGDDSDSIRAFGLDVVAGLCQRLLDYGVPGMHFYTLNISKPTLKLWERLSL